MSLASISRISSLKKLVTSKSGHFTIAFTVVLMALIYTFSGGLNSAFGGINGNKLILIIILSGAAILLAVESALPSQKSKATSTNGELRRYISILAGALLVGLVLFVIGLGFMNLGLE